MPLAMAPSPCRAGRDDHSIHRGASGGDARAYIFIGEDFDLSRGGAGQQSGELFAVRCDNTQFGRNQAQAGIGDHEEDALDARIRLEKRKIARA